MRYLQLHRQACFASALAKMTFILIEKISENQEKIYKFDIKNGETLKMLISDNKYILRYLPEINIVNPESLDEFNIPEGKLDIELEVVAESDFKNSGLAIPLIKIDYPQNITKMERTSSKGANRVWKLLAGIPLIIVTVPLILISLFLFFDDTMLWSHVLVLLVMCVFLFAVGVFLVKPTKKFKYTPEEAKIIEPSLIE